jgi:6-phosphogluconolactonase
MTKTHTYLFVGCCNRPTPYFKSSNGKGIATYRFDEVTGQAEFVGLVEDIDNPTFLAVDPERGKLYANSEMLAWNEGAVSAYDVDATTGLLSRINTQPTLGNTPAHISLDASGRFLLVANYGLNSLEQQPNQSVAVLPIRRDGGLDPAVASAAHLGKSGPQADRQDRPHAHAVRTTLDNRFLIASDLGLDQLVVYNFDAASGAIKRLDTTSLPPGSGPRHFVFGPEGDVIHVVNELSSTVATLNFDVLGGHLALLQMVSTVPIEARSHNHCSEIRVGPNGHSLYVANRGDDSIALFRRNSAGELSFVRRVPSGGETPRHFAFDPSGRFMAVANQDSDRIRIFEMAQQTGELTPIDSDISIGTPTSVVFCRL